MRVTRPQPGDLIVWRGHVGIVIDPIKHSFYSSLNSGLGTDFYDAPYWKARGQARFYRFAWQTRTRIAVAQQRTQSPTELAKAISSRDEDSAEVASTPAEVNAPEPERATPAGNYESPAIEGSVEIPSSILVASANRLPTDKEVAEAVSELSNAAASVLRQHDFGRFARKVVIYDKIVVQHVSAKGQRGSAKIRIDSRIALTGQSIERDRRREEVLWKLIRTTQGWEILEPPGCVYVPHDAAVHHLATRLALLTQGASGTEVDTNLSEQAHIVRVLSTLMPGIQ